eukprot:363107-Chlamydomonas_euryale.AAC.14
MPSSMRVINPYSMQPCRKAFTTSASVTNGAPQRPGSPCAPFHHSTPLCFPPPRRPQPRRAFFPLRLHQRSLAPLPALKSTLSVSSALPVPRLRGCHLPIPRPLSHHYCMAVSVPPTAATPKLPEAILKLL